MRSSPLRGSAAAMIVVLAYLLSAIAGPAAAGGAASEWARSHESRARLIAGDIAIAKSGTPLTAGIQIEMGAGWKTYWRNPGEAGGVPPVFDWTGSENVRPAVLYPAPHRFVDKAGETIGYKNAVTFPVALEIIDPKQPAKLRLHLEYGVCREICIPSEANLALDVAPGLAGPVPAELGDALARVPRRIAAPVASIPALASSKMVLAGDKPGITFEVAYPGSLDGADAFAEAPGGAYVPMPRRVAASAQSVTYQLDLKGIDLSEIKGKDLTLTLVSDAGSSEVVFPLR